MTRNRWLVFLYVSTVFLWSRAASAESADSPPACDVVVYGATPGGIAAHLSIQRDVPLRRVPVAEVQRLLVSRGGVITFYSDLPFDHPAFVAFQWLGARGLNPGYGATPEMGLTRRDGWTKLARILRYETRTWQTPQDDPQAPLRAADLAEWLRQARYTTDEADLKAQGDGPLNLARFAELVYRTISPRGN